MKQDFNKMNWQQRRELEQMEQAELRKAHKDRAFIAGFLNHGKEIKIPSSEGLKPERINSKTVVLRRVDNVNRA